jgi:hypothetical protein
MQSSQPVPSGAGNDNSLPNGLFVRFLNELSEEARRLNQPVLVQTFAKALSSMIRYPIPLKTGQDAKQLDGIGNENYFCIYSLQLSVIWSFVPFRFLLFLVSDQVIDRPVRCE